MEKAQFDPRVDAYIEKAAPFAHSILTHLRELMHQACPRATETIKWSMPFFVQQNVIIAHLAAFKKHVAFGFWGPAMKTLLAKEGLVAKNSMGPFGHLSSLKDLPPDKSLLSYMGHAADLIESGQRTQSIERPKRPAKKKPVRVPKELAAALRKNKLASVAFAEFSRSCRRAYCMWIAAAKRPETRQKRLRHSMSMISQGKAHYWQRDKQERKVLE